MTGHFVLGAIVGAGVVYFVSKKTKESKESKEHGCGVTEVGFWAIERGLRGTYVTTAADLGLYLPQSRGGAIPDDDFNPDASSVMVMQDSCEVYGWNGTEWALSAAKTVDLRQYLRDAEPTLRNTRDFGLAPPVPRPPEGLPPPLGPRPVPAEATSR